MTPVKGYAPIGLMCSGKDTFFEVVKEFQPHVRRAAFADELKNMAESLGRLYLEAFCRVLTEDNAFFDGDRNAERFFDLCVEPLVTRDKHYMRDIFQQLGTEGVRNRFGENSWVKAFQNAYDLENNPLVVTDCRFPNEADFLVSMGYQPVVLEVDQGVLVARYRKRFMSSDTSFGGAMDDFQKKQQHVSEKFARGILALGADGPYPRVKNHGTLDAFRGSVKSFLEGYPLAT
jgi:hypothetical protein